MRDVMLITGTSHSIGAATALPAAKHDYAVVLSYLRSREAAKALHQRIERQGGEASAVAADVTKEGNVGRLFTAIDEHFGRLDVLINNAGVLEAQTRLENVNTVRLHRVFTTSVTDSFLCAREAVKRLSTHHDGRGGSIVNVSSMASRLGSPNEYIDYTTAKDAIDSMTIELAGEVAIKGIQANAVRPGLINAEIHASGGEPGRIERLKGDIPLGRGGTVEEIARAVLWLVSGEISYSAGTFIDVSGGRQACYTSQTAWSNDTYSSRSVVSQSLSRRIRASSSTASG